MNTYTEKLRLLFIFISIFSVCVLPVKAYAYFSSGTESDAATFSAATLAINLTPSNQDVEIFATSSNDTQLEVYNEGSTDFTYVLQATTTPSCTQQFLNGIQVTADNGVEMYTGSLRDLDVTSSSIGQWVFTFSASSSLIAAAGETCTVLITAHAWQLGFPQQSLSGFKASTTASITFISHATIGVVASPLVVLNEIYPNEDNSADAPLDREWIELYNASATSVDVEGWSIGEFAGNSGVETTHVISSSNTCAPGSKVGYARPYNAGSTIISAHGLLVIEFCAKNRLNNNGDTIDLYDNSSSLADSYSYPATAKGKSNARIPDGGVWVDPVPTPGSPNTLDIEHASEVVSTSSMTYMVSSTTVGTTTASSSFVFGTSTQSATTTMASSSRDRVIASSTQKTDIANSTTDLTSATTTIFASSTVTTQQSSTSTPIAAPILPNASSTPAFEAVREPASDFVPLDTMPDEVTGNEVDTASSTSTS